MNWRATDLSENEDKQQAADFNVTFLEHLTIALCGLSSPVRAVELPVNLRLWGTAWLEPATGRIMSTPRLGGVRSSLVSTYCDSEASSPSPWKDLPVRSR